MANRLVSRVILTAAPALCVLLVASSAQAGATWTLESGPNGNLVVAMQNGGGTEYYMLGDVNFDNIVNGQDIAKIAANWLSIQQLLQNSSSLGGDANADGIVNGQDISLVAKNWWATSPPGQGGAGQVPEPSTGLVFGVWALGLWLVHRRMHAPQARVS